MGGTCIMWFCQLHLGGLQSRVVVDHEIYFVHTKNR